MKPFSISTLRSNTVVDLYAMRDGIDTSPSYQRQSEIWQPPKKQLLIDTIINGFDIPKLYFHELRQPKHGHRYAIIDGKQRLEAVWTFLDGKFTLSEEFEFLEQPDLRAAGLSYQQLSRAYPLLKSRFDKAELPIIVLKTDDLEIVEEMFSRLNEAVPLNAPEKRNALGGPLPAQVRKLTQHDFFTSRLPFANNRYRHLDLATKFLYLEYKEGLAEIKKRTLDEFVLLFKTQNKQTEARVLAEGVLPVLDRLCKVFVPSDYLLSSVGMVVVYYQLSRDVVARKLKAKWLNREVLEDFDGRRQQNRSNAREAEERGLLGEPPPKDAPPIDMPLLAFERHMQSPNDVNALKYRYEYLKQLLEKRKGK